MQHKGVMLGTKNSIMKQLARIQMLCTVEAEEYEVKALLWLYGYMVIS